MRPSSATPQFSEPSREVGPGRKASHTLKIVIVGAGLAGLALAGHLGSFGHKITVLEAAPEITEVGAGLTCNPNLTRLLGRWGLEGRFKRSTTCLKQLNIRRWQHGSLLATVPLAGQVEEKYGAPQYVVHRADLYTALLQYARENAEVRANSMVTEVDFHAPSVTLENGTVISADLVVGADGMKSICRKLIYDQFGQTDRAIPSGAAAFRACIPIDTTTDPTLRSFMKDDVATRWMGKGGHIQAYPIRNGQLYNIVMCHPDTGFTDESWTVRSTKEKMLKSFGDWDGERLRKLIDLIPDDEIMEWRLCQHDPLPTWFHGKVVLVGDACHPMLPYIGQGAGQAMEDVAVLRLAIEAASRPEDLPLYLRAYELARKPRADYIASVSGNAASVLHLADGPEQEARDAKFNAIQAGGENPDPFGNADLNTTVWQYDVEKDFRDSLDHLLEADKIYERNSTTRTSSL